MKDILCSGGSVAADDQCGADRIVPIGWSNEMESLGDAVRAWENQNLSKTKLSADVIQATADLEDSVAQVLLEYAEFVGPKQALCWAFDTDLDLIVEFREHGLFNAARSGCVPPS